MIQKIAIIGGGASGALTAIQLLQHATAPLSVTLVNKDNSLAKGFAYSTVSKQHLLNVRAHNMSLFPDKPHHFVDWAEKNNIENRIEKSGIPLEDDFIPRMYYGDYINDTLHEAIKNKKPFVDFEIIQKEAIDIEQNKEGYSVKFSDGEELIADKIVLAIGNFLPANISIENNAFYQSSHYIRHPYDGKLFDTIKPEEEVLIIGTGLTAVDVVLQLKEKGISGKITAISRNGYLPQHHVTKVKYPDYFKKPEYTLHELFSLIKKEIREPGTEGALWPNIFDSLRPYAQKIWLQFSENDKKLFVKKLSQIYNTSRHRMAGAIYDKIAKWMETGEFEIVKGSLQNLTEDNGRVRVELKPKDSSHSVFYANKVINCTGPESDYAKVEIPLVKNLVHKGLIAPDPLRLGLNATPCGEIIDKNNTVSSSLFTLGPPLKGILWECTAMPEIREQAKGLAEILISGK